MLGSYLLEACSFRVTDREGVGDDSRGGGKEQGGRDGGETTIGI